MWEINAFTEKYAIASDATARCLLIPGWSFNSDIYEWLLPGLAQHFVVSTANCMSIPQTTSAKQLVDALESKITEPAWIIGWSLGGNIAIELAHRFPQKVLSLCLLSTTPLFIDKDDWLVGMAREVFVKFQQGLLENCDKTLRKFDLLQTRADAEEKSLRHALEQYRLQQKMLPVADLSQGLKILGDFDQRAILTELSQPMLWCFGEMDAVVNVYTAQEIKSIIPTARIEVFRYAAHLPFLTHTDKFFKALIDLLHKADRQHEKKKVADSFSRAAASYDQSANLQQAVAENLLASVEKSTGILLDAGCGTGYWAEHLADRAEIVVALDMAHGMLEYGRKHYHAIQRCVESDLEVLPFAHHAITQIFSSLAVQWCTHPEVFLEEWHRVLKPGGKAYIATLGENTLYELRNSWREADSFKHVNNFLSVDAIFEAINDSPFTIASYKVEDKTLHYDTLKALMYDLKNIGAQTVVQSDVKGLMGKERFARVEQAYNAYRDKSGRLPATYEVIYLVLEKHL